MECFLAAPEPMATRVPQMIFRLLRPAHLFYYDPSKNQCSSPFKIDVVPCTHNRMLTDSPLLIRFNGTTGFDEITEPAFPLPKEGFRFRDETDLLRLANTNTRLPGAFLILNKFITAVKSTVSDPPKGKNHVMVTVKFDNDNSVILSLFDNQAIDFHRKLDSMRVNPRVIVATNINPRTVGVPTFLRGYAKVKPLSIHELNEFVITAQPQDVEFDCTGKVTGVTSPALGIMWSIADDTDEGLFVGFDGEMTKLHNMRAYEAVHLTAGEGVNSEETQPPPFIADMVGKTYNFQVRVSRYNFTANHQTFTISRIMNERDRLPRPDFVPNVTCLVPTQYSLRSKLIAMIMRNHHLEEHRPVVSLPRRLAHRSFEGTEGVIGDDSVSSQFLKFE
ncbi:unnamed protein product [Brassica oleracea]